MPSHRVAVIQWSIKNLAVDHNHATACDYIRSAAAQGAHLAVLPEYHLTGWAPQDPSFAQHASQTSKYLKAYQALAKDLNICLVPGTIVEKHPHPDPSPAPAPGNQEWKLTSHRDDSGDEYVLYNTTYFISNNGEILGQYRKKNIWHPEREYLASSASEPHEVFDTPIGKVGLLICWDVAFPEAFRELISKGAEIVVIPTYWGRYDASPSALKYNFDSEALFLESTLTARTFENTCAIIFANVAGEEQYLGLSRIVLPIVGPVAKMGNEEGVLVGEMDLELVKIAEENYRVRKDLRREGWYYSYRHEKA